MCTVNEPAAPSSPAQALAMLHASLGYLAVCDAAGLETAVQAEALVGLEQAEARHTAARARILAAFTAQHGFQADGHYGAKSWLRAVTKITRGAAAGATGWARRLAAHPVIADALAAAQVSASWARQICEWTDRLPLRPSRGCGRHLAGGRAGRRGPARPRSAGAGDDRTGPHRARPRRRRVR